MIILKIHVLKCYTVGRFVAYVSATLLPTFLYCNNGAIIRMLLCVGPFYIVFVIVIAVDVAMRLHKDCVI